MSMNKENLFSLSNIKKIVSSISYFFLFLLVMLCLYTFFVVDVMKKDYVNVFGYTYFAVSTGSMSGTIEVNDIIFVKVTDEVKVGDVITFKNNKGNIVTHRVIEKMSDTYITQGDVNNVADEPITNKDIIGKVNFVISPSFIIKLIALFLMLFIFLSLINFDKLVKKYLFCIIRKKDTIKLNEVPEDIFKSNLRRDDNSKSTGETILVPVEDIKKIELTKKEIELLDDELFYEKATLEASVVDEVVNLLKMRNELLNTSRITKKWINKFQFVYTLALYYSNSSVEQFKNTINNPTFDEIFDYDLEKIGFYEKLRSKIFDMPIHIYIRLMIYAVMYNDIEYFDGIYKILKYKIHLDVKNSFIKSDNDSNEKIQAVINFMKDFVNNYDNKKSFDLEKIDKLVKINSYEIL